MKIIIFPAISPIGIGLVMMEIVMEGYVDGCFLWCVPASIRAAGGYG